MVVEPTLLKMLVGMEMTVDQSGYQQASAAIEHLFRASLPSFRDGEDAALFDHNVSWRWADYGVRPSGDPAIPDRYRNSSRPPLRLRKNSGR